MKEWDNCPGCRRVTQRGQSQCKACGQSLSWSESAQLPEEARPQSVESTKAFSRHWWINLPYAKLMVIVLAWVVIIIISLSIGKCNPAVFKPKPDVIALNATVKANNYIVSVTNNDSQSWYGVELLVNGFVYRYKAGTMEPGQTIQVSLNDFATYEGDRFNPLLKKAQTIYIVTEKPNGAGSYSFDY